jgi:quercetin dioxygenase-like cupin family protein
MTVKMGEVYHNSPCRQRIVVRKPASDSNGVRSVLDLYVAPGGFAADYHRHPLSEERFRLVRGKLRVSVEDKDVILDRVGQTIAVPPNTTHRFFSASQDEETFAVVEFTNRADRFEELLLHELFGLVTVTSQGQLLLDQAVVGGIQQCPVRASRMASRGWQAWLRAVVR